MAEELKQSENTEQKTQLNNILSDKKLTKEEMLDWENIKDKFKDEKDINVLNSIIQLKKLMIENHNNGIDPSNYNTVVAKITATGSANPQVQTLQNEIDEINKKITEINKSTKLEKEKQTKMAKTAQNYFRGSNNDFQTALEGYNKDPNLADLVKIKTFSTGDAHLEQLESFKSEKGETIFRFADFDESDKGKSVTEDLIRVLANIKTCGGNSNEQTTFLDNYKRYLESLKDKKTLTDIEVPTNIKKSLKSGETQDDLINNPGAEPPGYFSGSLFL